MATKSILSKLTIIIPTLNRQKYALRNMHYWSGRDVTVNVIDGSSEAIDSKYIEELSKNVIYHHLPISIVERMSYALSLIKTEYTTMCGDDEFLLPSALEYSLMELEKDSGLVACIGRCLEFMWENNKVYGFPGYPEQKDRIINQSDPRERMIKHMKQYTPSTVYSVMHTNVWKNSHASFIKREFPVYCIGEMQFELSVTFQGKSKVVPIIHWLRSNEIKPIRGTDPSLTRDLFICDWWEDKQKKGEHNDFLKIMSDTLAETGKILPKQASEDIESAFDVFATGLRKHRGGHFGKVRAIISKYLATSFKEYIKGILVAFRNINNDGKTTILQVAREMESTGVKVNFDELKEIENIVREFHEKRTREYGN
jgi:glycosyltransferase domain-containing protein